jgi:hypothetical protein
MLDTETGQILLEIPTREAEVEQRGQEHVSGDAGKAIQVKHARASGALSLRLRSALPGCAHASGALVLGLRSALPGCARASGALAPRAG